MRLRRPPERVIGSAGKLQFDLRDGNDELVEGPADELIGDKEGTPIAIQRIIGRRPIAAFGNSDGGLLMLQWTAAGSGARFRLQVHQDDAERDWAHDRKRRSGAWTRGSTKPTPRAGRSSA